MGFGIRRSFEDKGLGAWNRRRDWDEQKLVSIVLDEVDNWLKEIVLKSLIQNKQKSPISGQVRFK